MESIAVDFVNREAEYQGFQRALSEELQRSVRLIVAPEGMGKSYLLRRMRLLASEMGIPAALIDFRDQEAFDYLVLGRTIRDQFVSPLFNPYTALINQLTQPRITFTGSEKAGVTIAGVENSTVTADTIVGGDMIRDNQFFVNTESEVTRRAAELALNDSFFECLTNFLGGHAQRRVALLFDSVENATAEASRWIRTEYLRRLASPPFRGIVTIIAGRTEPEIPDSLKPIVGRSELKLFTEAHVREYIEVKKQIPGLDIRTVYLTSGGIPGSLAKMALTAVGANNPKDDEWE